MKTTPMELRAYGIDAVADCRLHLQIAPAPTGLQHRPAGARSALNGRFQYSGQPYTHSPQHWATGRGTPPPGDGGRKPPSPRCSTEGCEAQMKRSVIWDSGFFLERAHNEWKQAPRRASERLRLKSKLDIQGALLAWRAIGVHNDAMQIRGHLRRLRKWKRRLK